MTEITYQPGGFFKRHQDFFSVQGNVVEEHTMLVCVTPSAAAARVQGGATVIHQLGKSHKLAATTTPGHAVVFRKDLEHEGERLDAGEKRVVSLNLLAIRDSPQGQVLHVTWPASAVDESAVDALRAAADANASYAIAVADVSSEPLKNCIEWANQQAADAGQPRAPVLPYCERLFSFEAFGTVFRILTRRAHVPDSNRANCPSQWGRHVPPPRGWDTATPRQHPPRRARVGRRPGQPPRRTRLLLPWPAALRLDPCRPSAGRPAV